MDYEEDNRDMEDNRIINHVMEDNSDINHVMEEEEDMGNEKWKRKEFKRVHFGQDKCGINTGKAEGVGR